MVNCNLLKPRVAWIHWNLLNINISATFVGNNSEIFIESWHFLDPYQKFGYFLHNLDFYFKKRHTLEKLHMLYLYVVLVFSDTDLKPCLVFYINHFLLWLTILRVNTKTKYSSLTTFHSSYSTKVKQGRSEKLYKMLMGSNCASFFFFLQ